MYSASRFLKIGGQRPTSTSLTLSRFTAGAALLLLATCHSAERGDSFDPALMPAAEAREAQDAKARAAVERMPYAGKQPFVEYRGSCDIVDRTAGDDIAHIHNVAQPTYVDTNLSCNAAYKYRGAAVDASAFEISSAVKSAAPPTAEVPGADVDLHTAELAPRKTCSLRSIPLSSPKSKTHLNACPLKSRMIGMAESDAP